MKELEIYTLEQVSQLVPKYEKLEFFANIADTSYSIEFFVTVDGTRMQCFDMIDNGLLEEEDVDAALKRIAEYVRGREDYVRGKVNRVSIVVNE